MQTHKTHERHIARVAGEPEAGLQTSWKWYAALGFPLVVVAVGFAAFSKSWWSR